MIRNALLLALILGMTGTAHAKDSVELTSGKTYEGQIVREENGWIGLETDAGIVWIKPDEIKSVTRGSKPSPDPAPQPAPDAKDEPKDDPADGSAGEERPPVDDDTKPAATPTEDAEPAADAADEENRRMVEVLGSPERKRRVAAAEWIVSSWPRWKPAVELALRAESEPARIEAVRLLDEKALGDTTMLLRRPLRDRSTAVQIAALRVVRHRGYTDFESDVVHLMVSAQSAAVRNEAVRTLEEIGGAAALPHVFREWASHDDKNTRRRYRRVLQRLLGEDLGDDVDAWRSAIDAVNRGDRKVRAAR